MLSTADDLNLLIKISDSSSNGREKLGKSKRTWCYNKPGHIETQAAHSDQIRAYALNKTRDMSAVCWGWTLQFLASDYSRIEIVSEIEAVEREMSHVFNIVFANKTDGTTCVLESHLDFNVQGGTLLLLNSFFGESQGQNLVPYYVSS